MDDHGELIKEEFTRQAASFEDRHYSFGDPRVLAWILANVPPEDAELVLDVAGGTGHIARAYAEHVHYATVLDLTAEMLAVGKREVDAAGVANCRSLGERGRLSRREKCTTNSRRSGRSIPPCGRTELEPQRHVG